MPPVYLYPDVPLTFNLSAENGVLKDGRAYTLAPLTAKDLPAILETQDLVRDDLSARGQSHFFLPKKEQWFQNHIDSGHCAIGVTVYDPETGTGTLVAHAFTRYPASPEDAGMADVRYVPEWDIAAMAVVQNVLVRPAYRGFRLMERMVKESFAQAQAAGKTLAVAEVAADNPYSWSVFVDCGMTVYDAGYDPRDDSYSFFTGVPLPVTGVRAMHEKEGAKRVQVLRPDGSLDIDGYRRADGLMQAGYSGYSYDRASDTLILAPGNTLRRPAPDETPAPEGQKDGYPFNCR